jgi:hypothetical protein
MLLERVAPVVGVEPIKYEKQPVMQKWLFTVNEVRTAIAGSDKIIFIPELRF